MENDYETLQTCEFKVFPLQTSNKFAVLGCACTDRLCVLICIYKNTFKSFHSALHARKGLVRKLAVRALSISRSLCSLSAPEATTETKPTPGMSPGTAQHAHFPPCGLLPGTNYSASTHGAGPSLELGTQACHHVHSLSRYHFHGKELRMVPFPPKEQQKQPKISDPMDCESCLDSTIMPGTLVSDGFDRLYLNFRNHP